MRVNSDSCTVSSSVTLARGRAGARHKMRQEYTRALEIGRQACAVVRSGERIYVIGGHVELDDDVRPFNSVEVFHLNWNPILELSSRLQDGRYSAPAVVDDLGRIFVVGGADWPTAKTHWNEPFVATSEFYNPRTPENGWQYFGGLLDPPKGLCGGALMVIGNKLYCVGGAEGKQAPDEYIVTDKVHVFDLSVPEALWPHTSWTVKIDTEFPNGMAFAKRRQGACVTIEDIAFIIGGAGRDGGSIASIACFDGEKFWENIGPQGFPVGLKVPRYGHAAAILTLRDAPAARFVAVMGGHNQAPGPAPRHPDDDLSSIEWFRFEGNSLWQVSGNALPRELMKIRYRFGATGWADQIRLAGGTMSGNGEKDFQHLDWVESISEVAL